VARRLGGSVGPLFQALTTENFTIIPTPPVVPIVPTVSFRLATSTLARQCLQWIGWALVLAVQETITV
jgi:hypothetical protein